MTASKFDCIVIGAGIAGLAAARELRGAGHRILVLEATGRAGGRIATFRHGDRHYDYGAQNLKGEDSELARDATEAGLLTLPIDLPVWLHEAGKIFPGDAAANSETKWTYEGGLAALPEKLAEGLEIAFGAAVESLAENSIGITVFLADGSAIGPVRGVVLAVPAPIAAAILERGETRAMHAIPLLREAQYSRCLTLMLEFERHDPAWSYYALLARDRSHPLLWLARDNITGDAAKGTSLLAQLGPRISDELWCNADGDIVVAALGWIGEVCGRGFDHAAWSRVHRWEHAQPLRTIAFDAVNAGDSRIVVCGDALAAARVPDAYGSGLAAARRLLGLRSL